MALLKMEDLKNSMCRWPIGDPRHKDKFHFCGEPRSDSECPYCRLHDKMAHNRNDAKKADSGKKAA